MDKDTVTITVTGGRGVGKTTVIRAIAQAMRGLGQIPSIKNERIESEGREFECETYARHVKYGYMGSCKAEFSKERIIRIQEVHE
jgi:Ni2+-binding GTPase involved in maturation of urease and hydrogenase